MEVVISQVEEYSWLNIIKSKLSYIIWKDAVRSYGIC